MRPYCPLEAARRGTAIRLPTRGGAHQRVDSQQANVRIPQERILLSFRADDDLPTSAMAEEQPGTSGRSSGGAVEEAPPETRPEADLRSLIKETLMEVIRDIPALASAAHPDGSTLPSKSYVLYICIVLSVGRGVCGCVYMRHPDPVSPPPQHGGPGEWVRSSCSGR